jgi:hypothetical protein
MLRDRPRVPIVLLITLALAVGVMAPASASASVPPGFVGMMLGAPVYPERGAGVNLPQQLKTMVASGVESLRTVFNWSYAQPYASWREVPLAEAGDFTDVAGMPTRFDRMDSIVELAAQRHLTLMPVVLYAPAWDALPHPSSSFAAPATTGPYASFVAALVRRYGPAGTFWLTHSPKLPIRMWQIWNEPNISTFWSRQPFESSYLSLLAAAHDAIKHADPGATIVLGGMPNYSWLDLAAIYRVPGARGLFDVVAVHPYTRQPRGVIEILSKVRQVMNQAGDRRKPIVADEVSWPSSLGQTSNNAGFDFATTEAGQARNLAELLPMLGRARRRLGLAGFYYYTWAGVEIPGGLAFNYSGLLRFTSGKLVAKPAFYAFRSAALALEGCRHQAYIATRCRKRRH